MIVQNARYSRCAALRGLTDNPGNDINPFAARGSDGTVWLVWQGLRDGNSDIFAACTEDFGHRPREIRVTEEPGTDWLPRVAVDRSGNAVVVWARIATATM